MSAISSVNPAFAQSGKSSSGSVDSALNSLSSMRTRSHHHHSESSSSNNSTSSIASSFNFHLQNAVASAMTTSESASPASTNQTIQNTIASIFKNHLNSSDNNHASSAASLLGATS